MKLWSFLKKSMSYFGNDIAFAESNITYFDLIRLVEYKSRIFKTKRLPIIINEKTKESEAILILSVLASGNIPVPVKELKNSRTFKHIKNVVKSNKIHNDTAIILFTSGSSGIPKGVMLSDDAIINNLIGIKGYFKVCSSEKILICRPMVHVSSIVGELFYGLCKGLNIYFYEEEFQPLRLARNISKNNINIICCTPTVFYHVTKFIKDNNLKKVVLSGEVINNNLITLLKEYYPKVKFYNVYGLTENSPRVSALKPKDFYTKPGSVGKPIKNTLIKIKDNELLVKSNSVMIGYLGNDELTKNKIKDGYLYTGDIAKIDNEGYLYVLGRKDGMIIRSGMNVYPFEIEQEINSIEGVAKSVVYGEKNINYGQQICAKVEGNVTAEQVRQILIKKLPPYKIPSKIVIVNSLKISEGGKTKIN